MDLGSPPTSQPTKLNHGEMNYDDKIRFGGWNKRDYKYVREKLKRFHLAEFFENNVNIQPT